ncbi:unnamed protein product [Acanthosepion pharaonis]|uniref:Peptidase A2 domain-containing protein n=1 Tax=Acanthosepion pharaonis TaxID=158019 RepID=A0A812B1U8_ACAPH|nr:unnamed protein product [Sepia pharaonis]
MSTAVFIPKHAPNQATGKRPSWQPLKALAARADGKNRLFYIHDRNNNLKFLVDTGAQISVIPLSNCSKSVTTPKKALLKLQAANGTPIITYSGRIVSFNIGLRRECTWTFTIADVETPILRADFNLSVELSSRTLTDTRTNLQRRGALSRHSTIGLTALITGANSYEGLL